MRRRGGEPDLAELIPRLVRFYGGSPMEWQQTPMSVVLAHMRMMPVIQAEELLDQAHAANLGRWMRKEAAKTTNRRLRRAANPQPTQRADMKTLAAVGIAVKVLPRRRRKPRGAEDGRGN